MTAAPTGGPPQRFSEAPRNGTVLVTGATGGLGPAVVAAFLDDGWRVVATSRSGRPPQDLVGSDRLESVATDLFEPADVAEAVAALAEALASYRLRERRFGRTSEQLAEPDAVIQAG